MGGAGCVYLYVDFEREQIKQPEAAIESGREASPNVRLQASQETTASRHFNNPNRHNSITQAQTCPGMHNIPPSLTLFLSLPCLWLSIFLFLTLTQVSSFLLLFPSHTQSLLQIDTLCDS